MPNGQIAGFIWSVADLLRGDYKQSEYGRVILPLTVLRRLDCVLEPTKQDVLHRLKTTSLKNIGPLLKPITGTDVYNTSKFTLTRLLDDPNNVAANLRKYIAGSRWTGMRSAAFTLTRRVIPSTPW